MNLAYSTLVIIIDTILFLAFYYIPLLFKLRPISSHSSFFDFISEYITCFALYNCGFALTQSINLSFSQSVNSIVEFLPFIVFFKVKRCTKSQITIIDLNKLELVLPWVNYISVMQCFFLRIVFNRNWFIYLENVNTRLSNTQIWSRSCSSWNKNLPLR